MATGDTKHEVLGVSDAPSIVGYILPVLVMVGFLALHVFLVMRFTTHARNLRSQVLVPKNVLGELIGVLGLGLMVLAIISLWGAIVITVYYWMRHSNPDGLLLVLGALFASPIIHLIAEMLVNVSYREE
jgi:hypothetical protein